MALWRYVVCKSGETNLDIRETGLSTWGTGLDTQETGLDTQETGLDTQETGLDTQETGLDTQETGLDTRETCLKGLKGLGGISVWGTAHRQYESSCVAETTYYSPGEVGAPGDLVCILPPGLGVSRLLHATGALPGHQYLQTLPAL
jgi:hypothetical protein